MQDQLRRRSVGAPAARSVLLTVLGEYVLPRGEEVWQETLIAALGSLGYKPQAARQALARSVAAGWLRTERHGRRARVGLSDETAAMLTTGTGRIYSFGAPWAWDGRWLLVVLRVPEEHREVRHQVRTRLAWAGFGSLGGGLWITPHVDREAELSDLAAPDAVADVLSFRAETGALGDIGAIAAEAWDIAEVAERYRAFVARFADVTATGPEEAFAAQTLLVHEWRRFPFLDPDLPEDLLPAGWPRSHAHDVFRARHAEWHAAAQQHFAALERGDAARAA